MVLVLPMIKTATFFCCLWARHRLDVHVHARARAHTRACTGTCIYAGTCICAKVCVEAREQSLMSFLRSYPIGFFEIVYLIVLKLFNSACLVCLQVLESPCVHLSKNEINSMNHCAELGSSWLYGKDFTKWAMAQPVNLLRSWSLVEIVTNTISVRRNS